MEALWGIVGFVLGGVTVYALLGVLGRRERERARSEKAAELDAMADQFKTTFAALSHEALSRNTDEFLKLAKTRLEQQTVQGGEHLDSKKKLIDAQLGTMNSTLKDLTDLTQSLDKSRRESVGEIKTALVKAGEATGKLAATTGELREALASSTRRGQWGERMAEDVLRLAGFVEGVNYEKQATVSSGERPDFTFLLPKGLRLNADVKFPLNNYLAAVDAADEAIEKQYRTTFIRDVRSHLKAVTSREYIDPEGGTVDCVLVFIPNEQVYGYLHQHDPGLMDDAIGKKIVLCSPLTLYAVLAVVRQAVDNFRMEQTSREVLSLLGAFQREWSKYCEVADKAGKSLDKAVEHFQALQTTRTRMLERQLDRIEDLRVEKGVGLPEGAVEEELRIGRSE